MCESISPFITFSEGKECITRIDLRRHIFGILKKHSFTKNSCFFASLQTNKFNGVLICECANVLPLTVGLKYELWE